ncbi:PTB domain-containing adapter protein ced-6 [Armadillidium vulgare]|nr:PTB domain-containing adapter protein ced-6 [Armadillidium vulgare]
MKVLYQYPLHQISYCADDKAEKRFFSFIAKESDREAHTCFVFISDKLAEEITLTIGQAFDLAYRKFLETSTREGELRRQLMTLRQQLQMLEKEKSTLEDRLKHVAALKDRQDLSRYMEENGISDLLFMNGVQSTEEPILHSPSGSSSDHSNLEPISPLNLPPVPPRNNSKGDILENHENSNEDDFDFDPRAEERKASQSHDVIGNGSASPDSMNGFGSDEDDFDPRAEENESSRKVFGTENSFEIKSPSLELNGIANSFPTLIPPPSRPRQQDKLIPNHLLDGEVDPFSSPLPADNVFSSQIEQIKAGFSRGLSFGTADNDFTLDSLDPLKN